MGDTHRDPADPQVPDEGPANSAGDEQPATHAKPGRSGSRSVYDYINAPTPPLEQCLDDYWSCRVPLEELPDVPVPPDEPYGVLKRLGPSPFRGSRFPLVGFFASAYERVADFARHDLGPDRGD